MLLIILIVVFAWVLALFLPWWSLALPCLLFGAWLGKKSSTAFLFGFIAVGGLWGIQSITIHSANNGILTDRIVELFSLPHPWAVILLTILIGGLAGGMSTLTGYLLKELN